MEVERWILRVALAIGEYEVMSPSRMLAVLVGASVIAGCGGGGGDKELSRKEFVAKADAICKDANRQETSLSSGTSPYHVEDPAIIARLSANARKALGRLKALKPREEDRKAVAAVLTPIGRMIDAADARVASLKAGKRFTQSTEWDRAFTDLATSAATLGLTECQGVLG